MAIQAKKQNPWFIVLLLIAGVVLWALDQRKENSPPSKPETRETTRTTPVPSSPSSQEKKPSRTGRYEFYKNCTLAADRTNDGDSFRIRLPDGREEIFRLYFVDTPESAFKSYRGGETNHQRIQDQADYFHTTPEKAVEIGQAGKHLTLDLLAKQPFNLYTEWDSPFNDQRYHAFIEIVSGGKSRFLHEVLVEKGLARIKTKPADLPDGTHSSKHRQYLEGLQQKARQSGTGAWKK